MDLLFGQRIDETCGLLEPWLTNPAMDEIKSWDLSDKVVMEYGSGSSTVWWAEKAKLIYAVDHNLEWFERVQRELDNLKLKQKAALLYVQTHEGDQSTERDKYVNGFSAMTSPDIVVVDGVHRYECIVKALTFKRPLTLIIDNWQQDYIFICPSAAELLKEYKGQLFVQEDHTHHEGHPWTTGIWHLK
jgi:hypothetical protein